MIMFIETLTQNGLSLSIKNGLLGVSPKQRLTDDLRDFIQQNKTQILTEVRKAKLDSLLSANNELQEQFNFEVEERAAIMIFDGDETDETKAENIAFETTLGIWVGLFSE